MIPSSHFPQPGQSLMKNLSKKIVIGNLSDKIDPDSGTEVCWWLLWRKEMKKYEGVRSTLDDRPTMMHTMITAFIGSRAGGSGCLTRY